VTESLATADLHIEAGSDGSARSNHLAALQAPVDPFPEVHTFDHLVALEAWKEEAGVANHPAEHVDMKSILPMLRKMPRHRPFHTVNNSFFDGAIECLAQRTANAVATYGGTNGTGAQDTAIYSPEGPSPLVALEAAEVQLQKNCARVEFMNGRFDSSAKIMARFAM
jgi:hypothetical protein